MKITVFHGFIDPDSPRTVPFKTTNYLPVASYGKPKGLDSVGVEKYNGG
jgi:hypothetical protein